MCGLMAGNGKLKSEIIMSLCCANVSRGKDSSGVAYWKDRAKIRKIAQHPLTAFPITLKDAIDSAGEAPAMLGHTRLASHGAVTSANAHPYLVDGIAFAHNGVITNSEDFGKYAVDSMALIHGIKARDFSRFVGSIALVWLEQGKLYAYRKGNPLFRGTIKRAVYLASERAFLERVGAHDVKELIEGKLYTFNNGAVESAKVIPANRVYRYTPDVVDTEVVPSYDARDWSDTDRPTRALVIPTFAPTPLNPDIPPTGDPS